MEQRSPEWFEERRHRLTASDFGSAAGIKGAYNSRAKLWKLKTGKKEREPPNEYMLFGTENEHIAIHSYQVVSGNVVDDCGLIVHPSYDFLASSPDGIIDCIGIDGDSKGCLEVKCRHKEPHQSISAQFIAQIFGQLACTGFKECHFHSWSPSGQRTWRVEWVDEYWEWLFPLLQGFWWYVENDEEPPGLKQVGGYRKYEGELKIEIIYDDVPEMH